MLILGFTSPYLAFHLAILAVIFACHSANVTKVCPRCLSWGKRPIEVVPTQNQVNCASAKMLTLVLNRIVSWWSEMLS